MPQLPFRGTAFALSSDGVARVAKSLGVFGPEVWTVVAVETSGCGYLPDRRSQILFERHIFHKLTGGRFDDFPGRDITVTFTSIQYSQNVTLNFKGLSWPHVSVNTLVPADPIELLPSFPVWK
jgi:hypothetical protein